MDNLMMLFSDDIITRYKTLLENIKNGSPSFYDSYNSLIEQLLKFLVDKKINGSVHTLINDPDINKILYEDAKIDPKVIKKILDYASKINKHKHCAVKDIDQNSIINYMEAFYNLLYGIAKYLKYSIPSFDKEYFKTIYKSNIKTLNKLEKTEKTVAVKLDELSEDIKNLKHEITYKNNNVFIKKMLISPNKICSYFSNSEFKKSKDLLKILYSFLLILSIIYLLIVSINNLPAYGYLLFIIVPYLLYFSIKCIAKKKEDIMVYNEVSFIKIHLDKYGIPYSDGKIKAMPNTFYYLFNTTLILDFIYFIINIDLNFAIILIIFDVIIFILSLFTRHYTKDFLTSFTVIAFKIDDKILYYDGYIMKYVNKHEDGSIE